MKSEVFNCTQANQIDMVDYLAALGHQPTKIRNNDYWYLSPLRDENEPSFKVNRKINAWYDHGLGAGGSLIDFGKLYHRCSVQELLRKLENDRGNIFPFHQQAAAEKKGAHIQAGKITVMDNREIKSLSLAKYLHERNIPMAIANEFCREVDFDLYGKKYTAIGFRNDAGGYELRNKYFKGSSSPKGITLLGNGSEENLSVFEGFFDFLSFRAQQSQHKKSIHDLPKVHGDFLVLNSLAFFERNRELMENHSHIDLYLDRDSSGLMNTRKALGWSEKYKDGSLAYERHKDLNEFIVASLGTEHKESRGSKSRF